MRELAVKKESEKVGKLTMTLNVGGSFMVINDGDGGFLLQSS